MHQQNNRKRPTPNTNNLRKNHHTKPEHRTTIRQTHQKNNPNTINTRHTKRRNTNTTRGNKMLVQIDTREKDRIQSATNYFKEQGLNVTVKELEIGDYIFTDGTHEVVFEFKLVSDFVASIQDGRIFNQSIEMAENYDHAFVMIHGDLATRSKCIAMSRNYHEVNLFQYIGAISSLNRYVTVLQCYSPFINESYYTMMTQAKKCLKNKPIVKKFPRKEKNPAFNWLCYCCYGINHKRASDIVKNLNLKTMEDLLYLDYDKLTSIDGIGSKMANRILDTISDDSYDQY